MRNSRNAKYQHFLKICSPQSSIDHKYVCYIYCSLVYLWASNNSKYNDADYYGHILVWVDFTEHQRMYQNRPSPFSMLGPAPFWWSLRSFRREIIKQHLISRQHAQPQSREGNWTAGNQRVVQTELFIVLPFPADVCQRRRRESRRATTHHPSVSSNSEDESLENTEFSNWGRRHLARGGGDSHILRCDCLEITDSKPKRPWC